MYIFEKKNVIIFRHSKLGIALAIPASNDEKYNREGRGAMARARSFTNVTEKYHVSPLSILVHYFDVLGQGTLPSHASLDSGVNEYLIGQRWQCVRLVPSAEMAGSVVCSKKGV